MSCMQMQDFYDFFKSQPDPKRLFGYSKYGQTYYAAPGQQDSFLMSFACLAQ